MLTEVLTHFAGHRNRPLSLASGVLALFAPGALLIFNARPALFWSAGVEGVLLLSVGISTPILLLCYMIVWTPLQTMREINRTRTEGPLDARDFESVIRDHDDPLEWPCLVTASWFANVILFSVATLAYFKEIRIGATMALIAAILLGLLALVAVLSAAVKYAEESPADDDAAAPSR